jgi:pyruvate formate lyase activating enzyme
MSPDEVLGVVLKDVGYYKQSGGGLTLSGGEPLVQSQFTFTLLERAHQAGLHKAIETTGQASWAILKKAALHADLILYDVKHTDPRAHLAATGVSNKLILDNFRKLLSGESQFYFWVRIPIIPNFNASLPDMQNICTFIQDLPHQPEKISLLPFHKFASGKYHALGITYEYSNIPLVSDEDMIQYKEILTTSGSIVSIGS